MSKHIPPIYDPPEGLGLPNPADHNNGVTVTIEPPLFDCQECGKRFPPTFAGKEIVAITCSCGADYTYLTEESSTEELLGL